MDNKLQLTRLSGEDCQRHWDDIIDDSVDKGRLPPYDEMMNMNKRFAKTFGE